MKNLSICYTIHTFFLILHQFSDKLPSFVGQHVSSQKTKKIIKD